jgi:hypothetical protein
MSVLRTFTRYRVFILPLKMAPKSKSKQTPAGAPAQQTASPEASGTATPASAVDKKDGSDAPAGAITRPDKKAYDQEQERIKREIDILQAKLVRDSMPSLRCSLTHSWDSPPSRTKLLSPRNPALGMTDATHCGQSWTVFEKSNQAASNRGLLSKNRLKSTVTTFRRKYVCSIAHHHYSELTTIPDQGPAGCQVQDAVQKCGRRRCSHQVCLLCSAGFYFNLTSPSLEILRSKWKAVP